MIGGGSIFVMDIDERQNVWQLKEMITEENHVPVSPKDLKLYVAKNDENWLDSSDPNFKRLEEGAVPAEITDMMARNGEMDDTYPMLHTAFGFPDDEDSEDDDIHILVDISEQAKKELRLHRTLDESVRCSQ
ncbi:snoRNA-binding rRNA-processing protein [Phytophthora oleae]|uniref:SnoRNA-binding rRNA-processing protein n=1 Tax=Phytophthora oleae TaxID=2107226 RepID=A0ABD3F2F6_9STRA